MRRLALLMLSLPVTAGFAMAAEGPRLVNAPVERVFVPFGFDDNDNVEVVLHGHFANTCYKIGPATAKVDEAAKTVTIEAQSYLYPGTCTQALINFSQSIKLGVVKQGDYKIVVKDTPQAKSALLKVAAATTGDADEVYYAPIDTIALNSQHSAVRVEGEWPYTFVGCMVMKEVRTELTTGNVLVVRPIAEFADGPECDSQRLSHKFSIETPLTGPLATGDYLIHARVLNGNSLNRFTLVE